MAFYDTCGVCRGNNECVGCDGQVPGPGQTVLKLDRCGVCGGNNDCVGCDGIAYKGNGQVAPIYDVTPLSRLVLCDDSLITPRRRIVVFVVARTSATATRATTSAS
jgi:hypothetical protein